MERRIERLYKYLEYKGISPNFAESECNLGNGLLSKSRKGSSDIGISTMEKILNVFGDINRNWLIYGVGPMLNTPPLVEQNNVHGQNTANVNTQSVEVTELQAKLREKDIEIAFLRDQLQEANMWTQRLWSYIFGTKTDSKTDSKNDKKNANS